ncbi:hypothetical protein [Streptomyces sp. NPDC097619]|uniref:hypothetical protein n=1 Tax=Streptomyces sp. NPDC097619 TaxID=3157228 RepID=UPI0033280FF8
MDGQLRQDLHEYDQAVALCRDNHPGLSADERTVRRITGRALDKHAPSNRTEPRCCGCGGRTWPCASALGAVAYAISST